MAKSLRRLIRGLSFAGGLALCAALLAMPVAATGGSAVTIASDPEVAADFTLGRPVLMSSGHLIDWSRALAATEDLHWTALLPEADDVRQETHEGVTSAGVEWTRSIVSHPTGVEWTRLRASDPTGSSWVETTVTGLTGVEWTFTTYQGAEGSSWTESRFLDVDGRSWTRSAPGNDLTGVEWT